MGFRKFTDPIGLIARCNTQKKALVLLTIVSLFKAWQRHQALQHILSVQLRLNSKIVRNYWDQSISFHPMLHFTNLYHWKNVTVQHPAWPSVVPFRGESFQMPIQRSRFKVPVLCSQVLKVAYFRRCGPFRIKHIITKSLSLLWMGRPNNCGLDSLRIRKILANT